MKSYIVTTAALCGLLTLAHIARMFEEGAHLWREPDFLISTAAAVGIFVWAMLLLRRLPRRSD